MICIKSVVATNCFAYELLEFEFKPNSLVKISASNGSGKSSIFHILQQGFFSKNSKTDKIEFVSNNITGKPYSITIVFTKDGSEYKIENSREPNKIKITKDGRNISLKTIPQNLKLVGEILGCNYDTFTTLCFQESDSSLDLVEDNKDSARKEFCNSTLRFNELDELLVSFESKRKSISGKNGRLESLNKQIDTLQSGLGETEEVQSEIPTEDLEEELRTTKEALDKLKGKISEVTQELKQVNQQVAEVELEKESYKKKSEIETQLSNLVQPKEDAKITEDRIMEIERNLSGIQERAKGLIKEQTKLELSLKSGDCPTCGNKVDPGVINYEISEINSLLRDLKENEDNLGVELSDLRNVLLKIKEYDTLVQQLDKLKANSPVKHDVDKLDMLKFVCEKYLGEWSSNTLQLESVISSLGTQLRQAQDHNTRQKTISELNERITLNNQKIKLQLDSSTKERDELENRLELINLWIKLLGPKGIRVSKMKGFLKQLNKAMVKYSKMLSGGKIQSCFYVSEDGKIEFKVLDVDKSLPFTNWSKGERARVKLSCLFSVLEVLEDLSSCSFNVLCLDEIAANLDQDGKDGLLEVLKHLRARGKSIYVISHSSLFNEAVFDKTVYIHKEGGLSFIKS